MFDVRLILVGMATTVVIVVLLICGRGEFLQRDDRQFPLAGGELLHKLVNMVLV